MKLLLIACMTLSLTGCAMPKWGNKLTTLILPDGRVLKAYVSSDGKMRYKDATMEWEIDNRGSGSVAEEVAKAAAIRMLADTPTAVITK